jgi:tyrosyl-tRNA synthetase
MKTIIDPQKIDEILNRGTIVEILPTKDEFRKKLLSGEKLRFYIGFDATSPTLHLSHAKNFMLMEKFRKLGHEVIILFGDFTARIGDPSGEDFVRKQLSHKEVIHNVSKWKDLVKPLMNFEDKNNPPKIMYNGDWLSKIQLEDLLPLASNLTVQQMLKRDMYQKRLKEDKPIYLHEFLYPLMQGYDSVAMDVDVEVCGTDQIFNALVGRSLLKKLKNKDKYVIAVTLMENPKTGELMSKSKSIGVFLDITPNEMYEQIMAQPDEMIEILFVNNTLLSLEEIGKLKKLENPRDAKMRLAYEIVKIYHGEKEAKGAQEKFIKLFQKREIPEDIKEIKAILKEKLEDVLIKNKIIPSKSEFRRLVRAKAIDIDNQTINDVNYFVEKPIVIKIGKKKFLKIKI